MASQSLKKNSIKEIKLNNYTTMKSVWRMWAKALGAKEGMNNSEADRIALIRTLIVLQAVITNSIIVAGVIRHW